MYCVFAHISGPLFVCLFVYLNKILKCLDQKLRAFQIKDTLKSMCL